MLTCLAHSVECFAKGAIMHNNAKDLTGKIFNRWTAIKPIRCDTGRLKWLFKCECGVEKIQFSSNVTLGKSTSCGCQRGTHNMSYIPEWQVWYSMVHRCTKEQSHAYQGYGGRGITVCDRWMSYDNFILDMGSRPTKKHQLDRIDNNKGYCKDNCRWVLSLDNVRNRRDSKYWFIDGVRYESMRHAAVELGVAHSTIKNWCNGGRSDCYSERKYK